MVRPARSNDAVALGAFFMQSWEESGPGSLGFTGANEDAIKVIASQEFLRKRLASPRTRMVVAEIDGRIVGFASLRLADRGGAELSGIVVRRSESGRGLGSRLLKKAGDLAAKAGFARLGVKTEAFNARAIGFYKKNGFLEMRKTTEKVGREAVPIMILEKKLR